MLTSIERASSSRCSQEQENSRIVKFTTVRFCDEETVQENSGGGRLSTCRCFVAWQCEAAEVVLPKNDLFSLSLIPALCFLAFTITDLLGCTALVFTDSASWPMSRLVNASDRTDATS